jgi:hypothetical protein
LRELYDAAEIASPLFYMGVQTPATPGTPRKWHWVWPSPTKGQARQRRGEIVTFRSTPQIPETIARLRVVAEELRAISPAPELTQHHALTLLKTAARLEAMTMRLMVTQAWKSR